jgi:hypothetical protein
VPDGPEFIKWHGLLRLLCMKKTMVGAVMFALVMAACAPSSKITSTWKSDKSAGKKYNSVFIAVLTGNTIAKSAIEEQFDQAFTAYKVSAAKSIDEFPPKFSHDSIPKDEIMRKVKQKGSQSILTISILKKTTESRYVSGVYSPGMRWGYYNNFWGYYSYWYPFVYSPDYYVNEDIYYMETNLYDITSEELVWSAQSQTYDVDNLKNFSKEFARSVVSKMNEDGILNARIPEKNTDADKLSQRK